jgi:glycosyltransferase involved in cell wall biosynthesis
MNRPLVSVIILTFNHAEFISETIQSVINQDYDNFEVIISDDCSSDSTVEIIKQFEKSNSKIKTNFNESNIGIVKNCNAALLMCRGEFIAFLGGDDLFNEGKITAQVKWFLEDEMRGVCGHTTEVFDNKTNRVLYSDNPKHKNLTIRSWIKNGMILNAQSLMIRSSFIPLIGFDERLGIVADWKFVLDLMLNGAKCGFVNGVYSRYRIHDNNISRVSRNINVVNFKQSYFDQLLTISYIEAFYPKYLFECSVRRIKLYFSNLILGIKFRSNFFVFQYIKGSYLFAFIYVLFSALNKYLQNKLFRI